MYMLLSFGAAWRHNLWPVGELHSSLGFMISDGVCWSTVVGIVDLAALPSSLFSVAATAQKKEEMLRDVSRPVLSVWVYLMRFSRRTHQTLDRLQVLITFACSPTPTGSCLTDWGLLHPWPVPPARPPSHHHNWVAAKKMKSWLSHVLAGCRLICSSNEVGSRAESISVISQGLMTS